MEKHEIDAILEANELLDKGEISLSCHKFYIDSILGNFCCYCGGDYDRRGMLQLKDRYFCGFDCYILGWFQNLFKWCKTLYNNKIRSLNRKKQNEDKDEVQDSQEDTEAV